jgi:radical SAM superfamily enzyme YgiQ (UPF0313 family)
MELPRRARNDELLKPGEMLKLRQRLRQLAARQRGQGSGGQNEIATVIACAFDHRTRMLPFIFADTHMAPAGIRAIGSALVDAGFDKTRLVLQQWNKNFKPSRMRLDGRVPDLFMVSSMGMHSDRALEMIHDARTIEPAHRPLIIAGGSHAVYQPFLYYGDESSKWAGPDVIVTGEEFVLLSLLEVILTFRAQGEPLRSAFFRAKAAGALDEIPGLMYPVGPRADEGIADELIDTGVQRLLGDLDELPHPLLGYQLLEPPSREASISSRALEASQVKRYSPVGSLVMTFGCKFACPYCPIPAYNQRQHRLKSPERIADEMWQLHKAYGLRYFFGTDDNFFNTRSRTLQITETLHKTEFDGVPLRRKVRWSTEVTVHDTLVMKEHLPMIREAGCRGLWLGVEDMTATLVKKGQSVDKTTDAFHALRDAGICPMPMMMHHDSQPLYSRGSNYGLLNQIRLLRKAGAVSLQVLMMTPSPGTKLFVGTYTQGLVIGSAGQREARPYMHDGNYVVASAHARPWRKQFNLLIGYLYFYNPVWLIVNLWRRKTKVGMKPACMQLIGMAGVSQSIRRTIGWGFRLMLRPISRLSRPPETAVPIRSVGAIADVAKEGSAPVQVTISAPRPGAPVRIPLAIIQ